MAVTPFVDTLWCGTSRRTPL